MSELLYEQLGTFSGKYPDVPTRPNFQVDDTDTAPFFMVLPIGKAGNVSGNGKLYDKEFYSELVRQVNHASADNPILGIVGHPDPSGASWKVDLPAIEWVGATLADDGMAWGKAYVYPEETKLRGTIRRAMRGNSRVATSIWGEAKMDGNRAVNPTIKRIDYADPERAGVKAAVAVPQITSEMNNGEQPMSDNQELISELRTDRDKAREQLAETQNALNELQIKYNAIEPKLKSIQEMAGDKEATIFVSELINDRNRANADKLALEVDKLISEQVKLPQARPLIATMLGAVGSKAQAETRLAELLSTETVKMTLQALALASAGGHVFIGEQKSDNDVLDESPEALAKARARYGV